MPTLCIECTLRAIIAGTTPPVFNESPQDHMRRAHPDGGAQGTDRAQLETEAVKALERMRNLR